MSVPRGIQTDLKPDFVQLRAGAKFEYLSQVPRIFTNLRGLGRKRKGRLSLVFLTYGREVG